MAKYKVIIRDQKEAMLDFVNKKFKDEDCKHIRYQVKGTLPMLRSYEAKCIEKQSAAWDTCKRDYIRLVKREFEQLVEKIISCEDVEHKFYKTKFKFEQ